jgi:hypothetical protein
MPFILTRINVGDYDTWKPMFDDDSPGARKSAKGYQLFRGLDNPSEVYVLVEFASTDEARAGRERLLTSGVLDRFADKDEPRLVEMAEAKGY